VLRLCRGDEHERTPKRTPKRISSGALHADAHRATAVVGSFEVDQHGSRTVWAGVTLMMKSKRWVVAVTNVVVT
jgi:hypothetical protein